MLKKIFLLSAFLLCGTLVPAKHPFRRAATEKNNSLPAKQTPETSRRKAPEKLPLDRTDGLAVYDRFIQAMADGDTAMLWQLFTPEIRLCYIVESSNEAQALEVLARHLADSDFPQLTAKFSDPAEKQSIRNAVAQDFLPTKLNGQWYIIARMPNEPYYPKVKQASQEEICNEIMLILKDYDIFRYWMLLQPKAKEMQIKLFNNEAQAIIALEKNYSSMLKKQAQTNAEIKQISQEAQIPPEDTFTLLMAAAYHAINDNQAMALAMMPYSFRQKMLEGTNKEEACKNFTELLKNNYKSTLESFYRLTVQIDGKWYITN